MLRKTKEYNRFQMKSKIAFLFTVLIVFVVSFFNSSSNQVGCIENKRILPNKTFVEHFYFNNYTLNFDDYIEVIRQRIGETNFHLINLGVVQESTLKPTPITKLNDQRADLYQRSNFPFIVPNGIFDIPYGPEKWFQQISTAISNQKQYLQFAVLENDENSLMVEVKGLLSDVNNKKSLHLNAVIYRDWAPLNIFDDFGRITTTQRFLIHHYPFGALGTPISIKQGITVQQKIMLDSVPHNERNMMGIFFFVQDMETKEVLNASRFSFAKEEEPAYFNWNQWPKSTTNINERPITPLLEYVKLTGLGEMKLSVTNAKDLKYLTFEIARNTTRDEQGEIVDEDPVYEILGASVNKNLSIEKFSFDRSTRRTTIEFYTPINGNADLVSLITKFIKSDPTESSSYKIKDFQALNSNKETIFYDVNDIKSFFPVQLVIHENLLDFNKDAQIDDQDLNMLVASFGTQRGDKKFQTSFNIDTTGFSKNRIDIADVLKMIQAVKEQKRLLSLVE
jgi:hypothetical protein